MPTPKIHLKSKHHNQPICIYWRATTLTENVIEVTCKRCLEQIGVDGYYLDRSL